MAEPLEDGAVEGVAVEPKSPEVVVEEYPFGDGRDAKYIRFIGYQADVPKEKRQQHPVTRIDIVNTLILVQGDKSLDEIKDALRKRVEGYAKSYALVQNRNKR